MSFLCASQALLYILLFLLLKNISWCYLSFYIYTHSDIYVSCSCNGGPFYPNYIDKPLSNKLAEAAQLIDLTVSKYTY